MSDVNKGVKIRRKSGGKFRKGSMDPSLKEAISRGQQARHRRVEQEMGPPPTRGQKKCSQCGEVRTWDSEDRKGSEFPIRGRRLKGGGVRWYPAGECKKCNSARAAAYREKLRDEGLLSEAYRRWNAARDPEARKQWSREYQTIQRRMAGVPVRGAWKKYRKEEPVSVNAEPLLRWLEERDLSGLTETQRDSLGRARERGDVSLATVDKILVRLGHPEMLPVLYGTDT